MKARKGGVTKSDDSGDYCTISEDIQRLEALKAQNLGLSAPPSFERGVPEWKGDRSWENLQADLLSEDFRQRLKHSLEHFTQHHQELAQRARPDARQGWEEADEAARTRPFQSPVASLATMGPAARQLAHMIHASQQRQHHTEYSSQWGSEEERLPVTNPWAHLSYPQQYTEYWRAQQSLAAPPPLNWESNNPYPQRSNYAAAEDHMDPSRSVVPLDWQPKGFRLPSPAEVARMEPASQAELSHSIRMLHEAQRISVIASSRIQEVYSSANHRKRKADHDDKAPASGSPSGQELSPLQSLFPPDVEQKCTVCGTTNTPVWRRINKQLVCNACGLRKRRSLKRTKEGDEGNPQAPASQDDQKPPEPGASLNDAEATDRPSGLEPGLRVE